MSEQYPCTNRSLLVLYELQICDNLAGLSNYEWHLWQTDNRYWLIAISNGPMSQVLEVPLFPITQDVSLTSQDGKAWPITDL